MNGRDSKHSNKPRRAKRTLATIPAAAATETRWPGRDPLFIVGIGASAGGLEALERFFKGVPEHSAVAFVVIPHLDPSVAGSRLAPRPLAMRRGWS